MDQIRKTEPGTMANIGAGLFVLWGVLHIWVGYEGAHQYLTGGERGLWNILIGGRNAPRDTFQFATDPSTIHVHSQLLLNFCLDVGGYGVLGIIVGWMIWKQSSWSAYFIGVVVIGIGDLAFLFSLVVPGIIELNLATVSGPLLWFLAVGITPFGMPAINMKRPRATSD